MRSLWILFMSLSSVWAQTLTIDQQIRLKTYNHKPSLHHTVEKRMKEMAKISAKDALLLAKAYCAEKNPTIRLTHQDAYLFYRIAEGSCDLKINALDGTLIKKESLDE